MLNMPKPANISIQLQNMLAVCMVQMCCTTLHLWMRTGSCSQQRLSLQQQQQELQLQWMQPPAQLHLLLQQTHQRRLPKCSSIQQRHLLWQGPSLLLLLLLLASRNSSSRQAAAWCLAAALKRRHRLRQQQLLLQQQPLPLIPAAVRLQQNLSRAQQQQQQQDKMTFSSARPCL
jgi:hypothetical protein